MTENLEVWFITGSQHLYGRETLDHVADNSKHIVQGLNDSNSIPINLVLKPVVTTPSEIRDVCLQANSSKQCAAIIFWMHTFSPAKMWVNGLRQLNKPICHLHTQFNAEIPWESIDMDFMNLNQSAHGDREFGHILTRLGKKRKIVVGHWRDSRVHKQIADWVRVCLGWHELQHLKVARFGDNMREVAVTEGDKVEAELQFGFSVNGYGLDDLEDHVDGVAEVRVNELVGEYEDSYVLQPDLLSGGAKRSSLLDAARIELGLRSFLDEGGFRAYTDTFENLGRLRQLPGIASQRLMADGYGFAAEGDWKTAAMVRSLKVMAKGAAKGTTFMEDYTYHFSGNSGYVLGSHMLEICPSIAKDKPSCEVHPLSIGGKEDPVRLVFNGAPGPAINVSLVDLGSRFRLLVNEVNAEDHGRALPKLPVASVLWAPKPSLAVSASCWMLAGGAHHTVYSQAITTSQIEDLAEIAGVELVVIDDSTTIRNFKQELRTNDVYFHMKGL